MTTIPYIPIPGTNVLNRAPSKDWWNLGSLFDRVAVRCGFRRVERDGDPTKQDLPFWSRAINGLLPQQLIKRSRKHDAWRAGASKWRDFIVANKDDFKDDGLCLIAHSHGGQVIAYLLPLLKSLHFPIYVITLDMPVRRDMESIYRYANGVASAWVHAHSGWGWKSMLRILGSRFNSSKLFVADVNIPVEGGHSAFINPTPYIRQLPYILLTMRNMSHVKDILPEETS